MTSLKFRHYATESALKGNGTVQNALNAFDVGTIVFIDDTQKQYIITSKSNNVVTYKIYYGKAAVVGVSGSGATRTLTLSDGSEITVTINNVEHATSSDTANTAKSVAWANVTNKPNLVTTDTEQTITGVKIFNNNTTFKNETNVESLTADSLLVTGSARFTNTINGNLKGNVEGNLTGNASTATTAATATEFSANKAVTLTGDVTGSASSKGGWSVATTIANGAVTNVKLANSKITIAGTAVSLGGSIAASTIGAALTISAPAAYATNAGTATKAAEAEKAIKDSDGNTINTTYLKRSGGTITGNVTFNSSVTADSITAEDLIVNGTGRFISGITGDLVGNVTGNLTGNAATATTALSCSGNSATATLANEAKNLQNTTPETKDESFFSKVVTEDADMVSFQTLKGNSVVWNQIIAKPYTFGETRDYTFTSWFYGGSRSINDKGQFIFITNGGETGVGNSLSLTPRNTHKYLLSYKVKANIASVCTIYKTRNLDVIANIAEADKWYFVSFIGNNDDTSNYSSFLNAVVAANSPETTVTIDDAKVTDLTQMFGAGNEPSTYEEFLQRKPKVADEYAYNEGTIVNNKVEAVVTTGRNLWDEEWELGDYNTSTGEKLASSNQIRSKNMFACLPNTSYYWRIPNKANGSYMGHCCFYDISGAFISQNPVGPNSHLTVTTPSNARFVAFSLCMEYGTTYTRDICINLSDPTINGQYFPYEKHELDLSWVKDIKDGEGVKLFEDGMKSAGTAFDEVGKGKAIKRIGVVNLGNLNWEPGVQTGQYQASDFKQLRPSAHKSLVCANYTTRENGGNIQNDSKDLWVWNNVGRESGYYPEVLVAKDTRYSSAQAFKQAVQGVLLYYELAEPIEVELPYGINHILPVWKDGMMYAESSQSSTPIVCTNAYYTNIRESVKKFIGDADSIYASTSGYNAHGTWNIDISGKAAKADTLDGYHASSFSLTSHTHSYIVTQGDNRSVATTPNDYKNKITFAGLKANTTIGRPAPTTYSYVVGLRGWSDSSGGKSHELAFNDNGIFHRIGATDTWEAWDQLETKGNTTGYLNAISKSGNTLTITPKGGTAFTFTNTTYSRKWDDSLSNTDYPGYGDAVGDAIDTSLSLVNVGDMKRWNKTSYVLEGLETLLASI